MSKGKIPNCCGEPMSAIGRSKENGWIVRLFQCNNCNEKKSVKWESTEEKEE